MSISDKAVEAAARAVFLLRSRSTGQDLGRVWDTELSDDLKSIFFNEARAALEAAAPHLKAPRLVNKFEELDALADGSIVLAYGEPTPYFHDWASGWLKLGHDSDAFSQPEEISLPATVLWERDE